MRREVEGYPAFTGLTYVTVTLRAPVPAATPYSAQFLVDTGATDTFAPADMLRKAGIAPKGSMAYELADGSVQEFEYGTADIEFM